MIYLDNAATTLIKPPRVKRAVLEMFDKCGNSGRSAYESSMTASDVIYTARERAAKLFGVEEPEEIIFTSNATQALNMAIKGIAKKGSCIISGYEHNSVVRPINSLKEKGIECTVAKSKLFDWNDCIRAFRAGFKSNTEFAVCTHVSNVFGYILPIEEIDELCYKKGIPLIIDASQSAGTLPVDMSKLKAVVCVCAPGHKGLYGPQGTGILVCRKGIKLNTILEGGTGSLSESFTQPEFMPDRFESGTMNAPGIAGLAEGISYVLEKGEESIFVHEKDLIDYLVSELSKMQNIRIFSSVRRKKQGGVISFISNKFDCEKIGKLLSIEKIAVRSGFHCAPLAHYTAGTNKGTVRVSVSDFTTADEVETFLCKLKKIIE